MNSKSKLGWMLRAGASLVAIGAAAPAFAQDAPEADVSEEIVVTATGRTAAIQDVPIAVQAINNETLEQAGVQSLTDLTQIAPTLRIGSGQSTTSGTIASIRGIGTGSDNPGFEGAVGIFIDGVYRSRAGAALADLPDVERIEILRGPQGTLFGKNTSAGAISVVTAAPSGEFGAWAEGELGTFGSLRTSFGAETPVTDNFAVRFDGAYRQRDGYIHDLESDRDINNTDRWTARLQGLFDISPDASFRLIVDGGETDENCCGAVNIQSGDIISRLADIYFPGSLLPEDRQEQREMTVTPERSYGEQAEDFGVSGELSWDIGDVNLTSITAYRDWSAVRDQDIDFTSIDRAYRDGLEIGIENFSQEIRLQGEWGRVNWLVGGFASHEELNTVDRIRFGEDAAELANAATFFLTVGGATGARKLYNQPVPLFNPTTFQPLGMTDVTLCGMALPAMHPLLGLQEAVCTSSTGSQAGALLGIPNPGDPTPIDNNIFDTYLPTIAAGDGQQADRWSTETESFSLFTHNEISLSDQLILTVGARYSHETKDMTASLDSVNPGCAVLQNAAFDPPGPGGPFNLAALVSANTGGAANTPFALACNAVTNTLANDADPTTVALDDWSDSREENEWSGTASLAYHLNDDLMVYGGYSRGYKAGGFNLDRSGFFGAANMTSFDGNYDPVTNANPLNPTETSAPLSTEDLQFEPEFTDAYEVGFKSTIFGGTTYFNANIFYQQVHDYQSNVFSGFNFFTLNVPELISQGVELELNSRLTDNLTINGGLLYNDAYYDSDADYENDGNVDIASGTPLAQAPEWTLSSAVNYHVPLSNGMGLNFFVNGRWVSEYRTMTLNRNPITDNDSFATFDARVSFGREDGRFSIELWGRNLTDEYYYVGGFGAPERTLPESTAPLLATLGTTPMEAGNYLAYPSVPQMWGLTFRARY